MTRKHFKAIAECIREQVETARSNVDGDSLATLRSLASTLCSEFVRFNSGFDSGKFLDACGF